MLFAAAFLALLGSCRRPPVSALTAFFQVRHLLLPLALPLAILGVLRGDAFLSLLAGIALACFWVRFGGRFRWKRGLSPSKTPSQDEVNQPADLRIATLNAGDHRSDPADISSWASSCGADVICLQEIHAGHVSVIERELAALFPHRLLFGDGIGGIGVLSRRPILGHEHVSLRSRLPFLRVDLDVDRTPLRLIVAHPFASLAILGSGSAPHEDMLDLAREAGAADLPCLLVGDLNTTDQSRAYDALEEAGLVDSWKEAGQGWSATFPMGGRYLCLPVPPLVRIDFVWHSSELETSSYTVGPDAGSDHLPVQAGLTWRKHLTLPKLDEEAAHSSLLLAPTSRPDTETTEEPIPLLPSAQESQESASEQEKRMDAGSGDSEGRRLA